MFADPLRPAAPPLKQLKVSLPLDLHLRLHQLKVLRGVSIQDMVTDALRRYFAEVEALRQAEAQVPMAVLPEPEPQAPVLR